MEVTVGRRGSRTTTDDVVEVEIPVDGIVIRVIEDRTNYETMVLIKDQEANTQECIWSTLHDEPAA